MLNLDNVSYIEDSNGKKAVILSIEAYKKMQKRLEELEDIKSYIDNKSDENETFSLKLVENLLKDDESKVKIMRQHRNLTLSQLAKKADISEAYLSQIENNKRKGTIDILKKLAKALDADIDFIT